MLDKKSNKSHYNLLQLCNSNCSARGLPNNIETYGLVSGLWTSTFALGAFVGPSVSGALFDSIGFRNSTLFVIGLHGFVVSYNDTHFNSDNNTFYTKSSNVH